MNDNQLGGLIKEVRQLRLNQVRLEAENRLLKEHVDAVTRRERERTAEDRSANSGHTAGDRVRLKKPSCPGIDRQPNFSADAVGTIIRINLPWTCIKAESNTTAQRHSKNIKRIPEELE